MHCGTVLEARDPDRTGCSLKASWRTSALRSRVAGRRPVSAPTRELLLVTDAERSGPDHGLSLSLRETGHTDLPEKPQSRPRGTVSPPCCLHFPTGVEFVALSGQWEGSTDLSLQENPLCLPPHQTFPGVWEVTPHVPKADDPQTGSSHPGSSEAV